MGLFPLDLKPNLPGAVWRPLVDDLGTGVLAEGDCRTTELDGEVLLQKVTEQRQGLAECRRRGRVLDVRSDPPWVVIAVVMTRSGRTVISTVPVVGSVRMVIGTVRVMVSHGVLLQSAV
ncbi:MAG: hypothetical protein JHC70_22235 [Rhodococcus sp.]|nr:hypothetical protein [Rhodococcus sp. (in: high G+C Gram-positive bacteria)]MBJ7325044.1 hypothetical protein [Rhodococcus sp. (in: high G+C Gram-positive bacteria)]